ncbi:riboflavin biosynthesis protein RibD [Nitrospira sp.]|nr:riboflavin biosynthesis protein RibD [Nitrospira sp.]
MSDTPCDRRFMAEALRLAARGRGATSPNPMVGALVVARGRVIAKAYHRRAGGPHAEVLALAQAGPMARGATLYLTLEPCCHTRKLTPPCLPLIVTAQVARIVIAMPDPNPAVAGRSIRALRKAGVTVSVGCFGEDAAALNRIYVHWMRTGLPWVVLKAGMTLDGKIATASGESRWITGLDSRAHAHRLRSELDAVMVGAGTVIRDNPQLTARVAIGRTRRQTLAARQPACVIVDGTLRISPHAHVLRTSRTRPVLVATTERASSVRIRQFQRGGAEVLTFRSRRGLVPVRALLAELARRRISSVLLEGGSTLNAAVLREGLVNQFRFYVAPRLLGGQDAISVIGGRSPASLTETIPLGQVTLEQAGNDLIIDGIVLYH